MIDMTYWCESCARKNNCYTIKSRPKCFTPITSNDRTADHKTEPTSSKMEQVDKDINVRSKDEPQTSGAPYEIETSSVCKDEPQIFICPIQDDYEALIEDEPQTERSACDTCQWYNSGIPCGVEPSVCKREVEDEPQTDCSWK